MTCRDNFRAANCTFSGAQLGYDNEGRLATWQNAPSSPTTTDSFLYDGAGNRVEQLATINGSMTTTTTYVAGGLEEISDNGAGERPHQVFRGGEWPADR
jgi:YD repeat-containing protein